MHLSDTCSNVKWRRVSESAHRGTFVQAVIFNRVCQKQLLFTPVLHTVYDRQNLCINEEVRRLGSVQRINDCCLEMQKNKHGMIRSAAELLVPQKQSNFSLILFLIVLLLCREAESQRRSETQERSRKERVSLQQSLRSAADEGWNPGERSRYRESVETGQRDACVPLLRCTPYCSTCTGNSGRCSF